MRHQLPAVPAACHLYAGKLTLVADLGRFVLESDKDTANSLPLEEASLYECLKLAGSNISAYLVDGDFAFSALEDLGSQKAPAPEAGEGMEDPSHVSATTAATSESQGKALGGSAIFIPLLERCGASAALQAARFPHPSLPPIRLQLDVPQLRFFFSPARLGRILRAVDAVTPGVIFVQSRCVIHCLLVKKLDAAVFDPSGKALIPLPAHAYVIRGGPQVPSGYGGH